MKLLFDYHCQNFICAGTMEALFYNQTILFYNRIVSLSLLFFVNGDETKRGENSKLSYGNSILSPESFVLMLS